LHSCGSSPIAWVASRSKCAGPIGTTRRIDAAARRKAAKALPATGPEQG